MVGTRGEFNLDERPLVTMYRLRGKEPSVPGVVGIVEGERDGVKHARLADFVASRDHRDPRRVELDLRGLDPAEVLEPDTKESHGSALARR